MFDKIKNYPKTELISQLRDPRVLGLFLFLIVVLLISWSGVKVIETNYQLQKQISALQQAVAVQELEKDNLELRNQYLNSNQYLDITARQNFGLAAPGEKLLLVPKDVALAKAPDVTTPKQAREAVTDPPFVVRNVQAWYDFFFHHKIR